MESIQITTVIPASAERIYSDWLDGNKHAAFTGGEAEFKKKSGSKHSAWDGYIWGEILELEEGERMLMTWTTSDFPEDAEPSIVEVLLSNSEDGCEIIINHTNIPVGQGDDYEQGWKEHYFDPMTQYYLNN